MIKDNMFNLKINSVKIKSFVFLISLLFTLTSCVSEIDNVESSKQTSSAINSVADQSSISIPVTSTTSYESDKDITFKANIDAEYAIVYNATQKSVLFEKNADKKCYPASLTKLMTAIVALEYLDEDEVFTVGTELSLVNKGSSIAFIAQGHKLTLKMLIQALLLPSGNDAAYTVAVGTYKKVTKNPGLSDKSAVAGFVELMNKKAKELGAISTQFKNPDGWHDDEHYTTTRDMLRISQYAASIELIAKTAATEEIKAVFVSGQHITWKNSNALIIKPSDSNENRYYNEKAKGLKTGYTTEAGFCLTSYAEDDGNIIFVVVMKSNGNGTRFAESNLLIKQAFAVSP